MNSPDHGDRASGSTTNANIPEGDEPLDPAAMLDLLQVQQRSVTTQMGSFVGVITATWGVAWLVGFLLLWLIDGARPGFALPLPIAAWGFGILIAIAIVISIVLGVRNSRGVKSSPASVFTGAVYGSTWSVSMIALYVFGAGLLVNGMPPSVASIYFPSAFVLMTGVLFMVSGAIWHAIPALVSGIWLVVVAVVAPFFQYPNHYLFLALAGGGAFIALAIGSEIYARRVRRSARSGARDHG
ncbi:hypothetical protein IWX78_002198 [Mycetocola sp. CAN_C7]|uniref:hypothetical protein n=1 Tax=Mycetocola sp. CAN_C7 TaxID=2787724 RepID=UPI0018CBC879